MGAAEHKPLESRQEDVLRRLNCLLAAAEERLAGPDLSVRVYTVSDVMRILKASRTWVDGRMSSGELQVTRRDGKIWIRHADLVAFLDGGRVSA